MYSYCFAANMNKALQDAEAALVMSPLSLKALLCKADVLFQKGDFETAMVWYYRGLQKSGNSEEFQSGILRCQETIRHAIEELTTRELQSIKETRAKEREKEIVKKSKLKEPIMMSKSTSLSKSKILTMSMVELNEKNLLEELYPDREFLRQLMDDPIIMDAGNGEVGRLVQEGMDYFDQRLEFWRARNPFANHESSIDKKLSNEKLAVI
jgi:hypothetical protein